MGGWCRRIGRQPWRKVAPPGIATRFAVELDFCAGVVRFARIDNPQGGLAVVRHNLPPIAAPARAHAGTYCGRGDLIGTIRDIERSRCKRKFMRLRSVQKYAVKVGLKDSFSHGLFIVDGLVGSCVPVVGYAWMRGRYAAFIGRVSFEMRGAPNPPFKVPADSETYVRARLFPVPTTLPVEPITVLSVP